MAHDVFISHAIQDKAMADAVCAKLEANGVRCWIAPRDIPPGSNWADKILKAVQNSRILVLVFSYYSNNSEWVNNELAIAAENHLHIIAFRIEDLLPTGDTLFFLIRKQWLDAWTSPLREHLETLSEGIKEFLSPPFVKEDSHSLPRLEKPSDVKAGDTIPPPPEAEKPKDSVVETSPPESAESKGVPPKGIIDMIDYTKSSRWRQFLDETLRDAAYKAVQEYLSRDGAKVKKHQVYMISQIIRDSGPNALETLVRSQKRKETSQVNKEFWEFIDQLLSRDNQPFGVRTALAREMESNPLLAVPGQAPSNLRKIRSYLLLSTVQVYFEHFVSHLLYQQSLERRDQAHANAEP
jgi:hypothetical protein